MTTYNLPHTDDLAVASHLPLGLVVQPFAPLRSDEHPIPVIDYGDVGPPRCERCRGYINAWCIFIEGGQKFICNLCGSSTPGKLRFALPTFTPYHFAHIRSSFQSRASISATSTCRNEGWISTNDQSYVSGPSTL